MKKGISNVVSIVLIMLVLVFAISMVWLFILSFISIEGFESAPALLRINLFEGYSVYSGEDYISCLQLERSEDDYNISGFNVYFVLSGNSEGVTLKDEFHVYDLVPEKNGMRTVCFFHYGHYNPIDIEKVYVAPFIREGENEIEGKKSNTARLKEAADLGDLPVLIYSDWCNGLDADKSGILESGEAPSAFQIAGIIGLWWQKPPYCAVGRGCCRSGLCCDDVGDLTYCCEDNYWCDGADFNRDGKVDSVDAQIMMACWHRGDTCSPDPNDCSSTGEGGIPCARLDINQDGYYLNIYDLTPIPPEYISSLLCVE